MKRPFTLRFRRRWVHSWVILGNIVYLQVLYVFRRGLPLLPFSEHSFNLRIRMPMCVSF
jgi:hypothetical protein